MRGTWPPGARPRGPAAPPRLWGGGGPGWSDFLSWSLPLFRWRVPGAGPVEFRLHLIFVVVIVARLAAAAFPGADPAAARLSLPFATAALLILLGLAIVHEAAHLLVAASVGEERPEIMLWPFGGLEGWETRGPSALRIALAGPLVHLAILAVGVPALGLATGEWLGTAIPNPLDFSGLYAVSGRWWATLLYLVNFLALATLLVHLLPLPPLDGSAALVILLRRRLGELRARRAAIAVGYATGVGLVVLAIVLGHLTLALLGVFGFLACLTESRRLAFTAADLAGGFGGDADEGRSGAWRAGQETEEEPDPEAERARRRREKLAREAEELEAVLAKISRTGLASLTPAERRVLARETERRRQGP